MFVQVLLDVYFMSGAAAAAAAVINVQTESHTDQS